MVDLLLLQTVSVVIASAGVFVAAVYYILQIKHQTKMRQTDLMIRLYSFIANREFLEAWEKIRDVENLDDYGEKYGYVELNLLYTFYQEIGMLLQRKLIDAALVDDLIGRQTVLLVYDKFKPYHEYVLCKRLGTESGSFDYLYNEMKKRVQGGVKSG